MATNMHSNQGRHDGVKDSDRWYKNIEEEKEPEL